MGTAARRSREQSRKHTHHWAQPQSGTLTYVALGDSAGVGVGVDDPSHGYVGLTAQRLAQATGESVRVLNLSVSGAKATDVLERQVPKLAQLPTPDFTTCVIGGNDVAWSGSFHVDDFASDMALVSQQLPASAVMGLVPHFMHWPYEGRARKANQAIAQAAALRGHRVADIHSATKALSVRGYLATFARDYFHPNEHGHEIWANALWEQFPLVQLSGVR